MSKIDDMTKKGARQFSWIDLYSPCKTQRV